MTAPTVASTATTVLASGIPIVVLARRDVPIATVAVAVAIGSRSEPLDRTGYAHLAEHLLCVDAAHVAGVEAASGRSNASTRADRTVFHSTVVASEVSTLLRLEAQRFAAPTAPADAVRRQAAVVAAEVDARFGRRPHMRFPIAELRSMLFEREPNRRDRASSMVADVDEAISAMPQYLADHYVPSRLAVAIVGDVDAERTLDEAAERWQDVPVRAAGATPAIDERATTGGRTRHADGADAAMVGVGWSVPDVRDVDRLLATVVLGTMLADDVGRSTGRGRLSSAVGVDLLGDPLDVAGPTGLVARALVDDGEDVERAADVLLADLREAIVDASAPDAAPAFAAARASVLARLGTSLDDVTVQAATLASRRCDGGDVDAEGIRERIRSMAHDDVAAAAAMLGEPACATVPAMAR